MSGAPRRHAALLALLAALASGAPALAAPADEDETPTADETPEADETPTADETLADEDETPEADEDPIPDDDPPTPGDAAPAVEKARWGGVLIPLIGATTVDGFGFGLGGEVFRRPAGKRFGYDLKLTPSLYVNTRFDYTNDFLRIEWGRGTRWLATVGYQQWANLSYAGIGGADVLLDRGEREIGSDLITPYAFAGALKPVGREGGPWRLFTQLYLRLGIARAADGTLLADDRPFGLEDGVYGDVSIGVQARQVDRWPMPFEGQILEASLRAGGTVTPEGFAPLAGIMVEGRAWQPLAGPALVLGTRLLVDKTVGRRPFFEQDRVGGRWRDEIGSEQALPGYGRTRTRGDGVVAAMVELRPRLGAIEKGWFELAFYLSGYAEMGWLFDRWTPGPPLPSVGGGPVLLWQKAVQLRPFLAWGWRAEDPDAPRRPGLQFGISVLDAL